MSPVASGDPPHTRATPLNGGGPVRATNGLTPNGMDNIKGTNRVFLHLDDLLRARPDVNINTPFKTILQRGEDFSKQAETTLDFRRLDIALQEYMKATIIAVEILPKHKDFSALRDRQELNRLYMGFSKRINAQHQKFTDVKELIKENNIRNGVKPQMDGISAGAESIRLVNGGENGHARTRSESNDIPGKRPPPPLQPKPDALHGNAIPHTSNGTQPADLAARFARLRSLETSPQVQDPRIRTQPIFAPGVPSPTPSTPARNQTSTSRAAGPRQMPSVPAKNPPQPKTSVDVNVNGSRMPRPPDAIYSPDRGIESTVTIDLKSSSSFSNVRKYSAPPISTVGPSPLLLDDRREYFSPAHAVSDPSSLKSMKRKQPSVPDSTMISAEDLMKYIGQGSQSLRVLIVDLRNREDFDSGHIMSQSIICVEPITLRQGISGEDLSDTMVVAPDAEQKLYEQRQDFDLVVVYDQSSTSLTTSLGSENNSKLQDFVLAVYDYGYEKRLKHHPALLVGGLNAWIDLLGPNALQVSTSGDPSTSKLRGKSDTSLAKALALRNSNVIERSKRRSVRQLTSREQNYWESKLSAKGVDSEDGIPDEFSYAKTTEDFFRRYPELPSPQQSMVSPIQGLALEHQRLNDELQNLTPRPPTRPAAALPRQRSSGISDRPLMVSHAHAVASNSITSGHNPSALTGLTNKGNTCYINSAVQAISATVFLRDFLKDFKYPAEGQRFPVKPGENGRECAQLMIRCFGNLLGHLWQGTYDYVSPSTFLNYIVSVDDPSKPRNLRFAIKNGDQQDAGEFYLWLINMLEDESNAKRDAHFIPNEVPDDFSNKMVSSRSLYQHRLQLSPGLVVRLSSCKHMKRKWTVESAVSFLMHDFVERGSRDLVSHLERLYGTEDPDFLPDYACEGCHRKDTTHSTSYISHFPDYLVINLGRFRLSGYEGADATPVYSKTQALVQFDETVDLSKCFVPIPESEQQSLTRQAKRPFKYDVYAVIRHSGSTLRSGHYTALTRHPDQPRVVDGRPGPGCWHLFNDEAVSPFPSLSRSDLNKDAAMLFLKRTEIPLY